MPPLRFLNCIIFVMAVSLDAPHEHSQATLQKRNVAETPKLVDRCDQSVQTAVLLILLPCRMVESTGPPLTSKAHGGIPHIRWEDLSQGAGGPISTGVTVQEPVEPVWTSTAIAPDDPA